MLMIVRACVAAGVIAVCCAQSQVITTVAGTDWHFPMSSLQAVNAPLGPLTGVAVDAQGNLYAADAGNNLVVRISTNGLLTVVAGNGITGFSGDGGPATSASLNFPLGVAVDSGGNIYIVDSGNNRIREVSQGMITTVAGNGIGSFSGDGGPATSASLWGPGGLALDSASNLYIADVQNNRIRKVSNGTITTVAGNGIEGFSGDGGPATLASIALHFPGLSGLLYPLPDAVAVDSAGNLYISDTFNSVVRKVSGGTITTVAGAATYYGTSCAPPLSTCTGPATKEAFSVNTGVAVDSSGNLYIADSDNELIWKVSGGIISIFAGSILNGGFSGDGGPALGASLNFPAGLALDPAGNLYIADEYNDRVRKISAGTITTVAGNGTYLYSGDGGPATSASLNNPQGVAVDSAGKVYIADAGNNRIREISDGTIMTVAGNGNVGIITEGAAASSTSLDDPTGVAVDSAGNLYIADLGKSSVLEVSGGTITTVAGNGTAGFSPVPETGPATGVSLACPSGVGVDSMGNVFIAESCMLSFGSGGVIQELSGRTITTIASNGMGTLSGNGGDLSSASLNGPFALAVDAASGIYIADTGNNRVRKVSGGAIFTVAGNGSQGFAGDGGPAISASLNGPKAVALDSSGNLYIADTGNNRVRKVSGGTITTVAGNGIEGFSGDGGPAISASFNGPSGVAVDSAGNLYVADSENNRIRLVLATVPKATVVPTQLQFTAAANGAPTQPQTLSLTSPVNGLAFSVSVPSDATWLQVNPSNGASPRLIQVVADPAGLAPMTYQSTLTVNVPNGRPSSINVAVTFTVTSALSPVLSIDKASLSFPFPIQGSARSQTVTVSNAGGGTLPFTARATTSSGGNWLTVSATSAQALPGSPVAIAVTANPSGLAPGAYSGQVTVTSGAQSQTVAVTMTISVLSQAILLSQSGLSFLAVQNGGVVPSQSFAVMNIGTGMVNWTTSTTTLTGGNWLEVTPSSGSSDASAETSPRVTVSVNASSLPAGVYYGLVLVDAPGAANTPQVLTVFLQVLSSNAFIAPVVQPAQLLFTATAGGESPGSQLIQAYNIVPGAKSFQSQISADTGLSLITLPQDATLDPQQPTSIVVQPITTGLSAGVYNGTVTLQFSDGTVSAVQVSVIVSNAGGTSASARNSKSEPADSTPCTPSKLVPALTTLGQTFTVSAGWPAALVVNVKDDCGMPMQPTGSVTVSFSNGDAELSLQSQGSGSWESTWQTGNATTDVTLTVQAANQGLSGNEAVNGSLASQQQPPVFGNSGIVSAATAVSFTALAPGSAISIYGNMLAESAASAETLPLPSQLVNTDTQVFVSGTTAAGTSTGLLNVPLYYVSPNQVNALIPYEVSVDTSLQLLVQRGPTLSVPVQINTAQAQPAVFSISGEPGSAGLIQVYPAAGGQPYFASASEPAHAGDTIVLYCTGLGTVNPAIADGAAPSQLSNTTSKPQLMIGGQSAQVEFSGLAPGFAGLYQVNAVVPSGTQTGATVPVTLSIDGQTSPQVTLAIQ